MKIKMDGWMDGVEEDVQTLGCRNWWADAWDREVAGDICLRRPRPTQSSRTNDDDDDDDGLNCMLDYFHSLL